MEEAVLVTVARVEAGESAARFMDAKERHAGN
jgi:hypothetical protein